MYVSVLPSCIDVFIFVIRNRKNFSIYSLEKKKYIRLQLLSNRYNFESKQYIPSK
jgi:hypothetical protein